MRDRVLEIHTGDSGQDGSADSRTVLVRLRPECVCAFDKNLKKQWRRFRKELRRLKQKFSAKAVHESRVATRRLLATVQLLASFSPEKRLKKLRQALKGHLDCFDDLRDTQVQLASLGRILPASPLAAGFKEWLQERQEAFARRTGKRVKRTEAARISELVAACRKDYSRQARKSPPEQVARLLAEEIQAAFDATCELRRQIVPEDTRTIHCTRVAFKKFRYMVEALQRYLPAVDQRLTTAMHDYQTLMGNIQDAEMLLAAFDQFACKTECPLPGFRAIRQQLVHRRKRLVREYLAHSERLFDFWPLSANRNARRNGKARFRLQPELPRTRSQ